MREPARTLPSMTATTHAHARATPAPRPAHPQAEMVSTRLGPVAVRRTPTRGPGPHAPAVMVHGLGGSSRDWVDLADALADRLDCVSLDLPGFGRTPPQHDDVYTIARHAAVAVAVTEALFPGQRVHLFGNSMGGVISVRVAGLHPHLVRSLTLVSPAMPDFRPASRGATQVPVMAIAPVGRRIYRRMSRLGPAQRVQGTLSLCFADLGRVHPQRREEAIDEAAHRATLPYAGEAFVGSATGLLTTYFHRGRDRPWALARRVQAPTLLVYGRRDQLVNVRNANRATRFFGQAHVMVIPDCGHVAMMEHHDLVGRGWRELLDDPA
jgi:pimeloyl-ACP methyl ester carboxylesterase